MAAGGFSSIATRRCVNDMIAIAISHSGGPEVLRPVELPEPRPGAGEVSIRVAAAGVNRYLRVRDILREGRADRIGDVIAGRVPDPFDRYI